MMTTQNMKRNPDDDKAAKAAEAAKANDIGEDLSKPMGLAEIMRRSHARKVEDADAARSQREDRTVHGNHDNTAAFVAEHKPRP